MSATLVRGGKEQRVWVDIPVVEPACSKCKQAVNTQGNQLSLEAEPDYKTGTLLGGIRCSRCGTVLNVSTYYFHDNFQPATYLALCILTDENPQEVLSRGFLPGKELREGVFIAEGARIGRNVKFVPPVLINKGSVLADGCEIGPMAYLEDAKIEKNGVKLEYCDLRRSILNQDMSHGIVHDSYVG